jgi:hypothetical protein
MQSSRSGIGAGAVFTKSSRPCMKKRLLPVAARSGWQEKDANKKQGGKKGEGRGFMALA